MARLLNATGLDRTNVHELLQDYLAADRYESDDSAAEDDEIW